LVKDRVIQRLENIIERTSKWKAYTNNLLKSSQTAITSIALAV
jgi:hypothetical protein